LKLKEGCNCIAALFFYLFSRVVLLSAGTALTTCTMVLSSFTMGCPAGLVSGELEPSEAAGGGCGVCCCFAAREFKMALTGFNNAARSRPFDSPPGE